MTHKESYCDSLYGETALNQLTIRGLGPELEAEIRGLAERPRLSLNQAVLALLRRGTGRDQLEGQESGRIGSSLDHLAGTWSNEEARAMAAVEADFERVDPELWE